MLGPVTALQQRRLHPKIDRARFERELEEVLQKPATALQGMHPHMCVPAALESYLAQVDPEGFVELAVGLASPEGKVRAAGGLTLLRIEDALEDDGTDRRLLDRLVQAALFAGAQQLAGRSITYSSLDHSLDGVPARGLSSVQTEELLEQLTSQEWSRKRPSLDTLRVAARQGPVPVVLSVEGGGHQLLLQSLDEHEARLFDPEGEVARAFPGARLEDGFQVMSPQALEEHLAQAYLKIEQIPAEELSPEEWMLR